MRVLILATMIGAAGLVGCGAPGSSLMPRRTYVHDFTLDNQLDVPLTVSFYGYYGGYCDKGIDVHQVAAGQRELVEVRFVRCTNGGGRHVASISATADDGARFHLRQPGEVVACDRSGCQNVPLKNWSP